MYLKIKLNLIVSYFNQFLYKVVDIIDFNKYDISISQSKKTSLIMRYLFTLFIISCILDLNKRYLIKRSGII